jgi:phage gpG-like protein
MASSKFNFDRVKANLARTKRELPIVLAKLTENHFTDSFKKGALDEHKWEEVQRRINGTPEYKYPKKKGLSRRTSPILVRSGSLRTKVSRSITNATWQQVRLAVDLPYAEAQNNGTDHIVARPFMIQTNALEKEQLKVINDQMIKIWKT